MLKGGFLTRVSKIVLFFFVIFIIGNNFSFAQEEVKKEGVKKLDAGVKKIEKNEKDGNVIAVPSSKKKKKKFPWLLVVGGAVVVGVVVALLLSKKDSTNNGSDDSDYDTRVLGIEWVRIPEGEFKMGMGDESDEEGPVHAVYLDEYYISKYEVTFAQYDIFCDETGKTKPEDEGWGRGLRPVIHVNWHDAKAFCDWLSQKTGKNIHLLTEAQWEKSARGTDQRIYPWGNSYPDCSTTNYNNCQGKTMPVGSYPSGVSPYGVHDMAGNVWEWCQDWYSSNYYSNSTYKNPTGPANGTGRVVRGGDWSNSDVGMLTWNRHYIDPPSRHDNVIGFRLCYEK